MKMPKPHLTPEHYESEGKGWAISKQSARPEFLKWLDAFITEKKALIRKERGKAEIDKAQASRPPARRNRRSNRGRAR
jgi:hypothetical protein